MKLLEIFSEVIKLTLSHKKSENFIMENPFSGEIESQLCKRVKINEM